MAKTLLQVLLCRCMVRVGAMSPEVAMRIFVDDFGMQWSGAVEVGARNFQEFMDGGKRQWWN